VQLVVSGQPRLPVQRVYKASKAKIDDYSAIIDELIEKEKTAQASLAGLIPERRVLAMMEGEKKQLQTIVKDMEQELEKKNGTSGKK
jgi:hypothetical protein